MDCLAHYSLIGLRSTLGYISLMNFEKAGGQSIKESLPNGPGMGCAKRGPGHNGLQQI